MLDTKSLITASTTRAAKPNSTHARALGGSKQMVKPYAVTYCSPGMKKAKIKARFSSLHDAETYIGELEELDYAGVRNGWYGIDGPEEKAKVPRNPRTLARKAEKHLVSDCSVPELVDVLIQRGRRSNGFSSLTTKQRLNLIAHLIAR